MSRFKLVSPLGRIAVLFQNIRVLTSEQQQGFHMIRQGARMLFLMVGFVAFLPHWARAHPAVQTDSLTQAQVDTLTGLLEGDQRLNAIFWRLSTANAPYCAPIVPATGMVLHARSAYLGPWQAAAQQFFAFEGEIAVEAVDPDSPAERAGVLPNDTLVMVAGRPLGARTGTEGVADAYDRLASAGASGAVDVTVLRAGRTIRLTVPTVPSCTQRIELRQTSQQNARTDGEIIQINSVYLNLGLSDARLASIIAHELGHYVLHHPQRLRAAGAYRGLKSLFGGDTRLIYRTEAEADRISPYLMVNAGYDPQEAVAFWASFKVSGLLSASHAAPAQRAAMIQAEVDRINRAGPPPIRPPFIDTRDQPLR